MLQIFSRLVLHGDEFSWSRTGMVIIIIQVYIVSRPLRIRTLYCNSIVYSHTVLQQYCILAHCIAIVLYTCICYHAGAGPTKLVPMQNETTKDLPQRVVCNTLISLLALRCVTFLSPKRYNLAVFIYLRLYLYISGCIYIYISGCTYIYISGCTYISPAVFIYLRLYLYISGCIYISLAVFTYLQFYTILTQTAPEDFDTNGAAYINSGCIYIIIYISGCTYISPAVLIYLRLYLYISGCIYISPAVFIYLRLYLYISGCTYISPVLLNFDTNGAHTIYTVLLLSLQ